MVVASEMGACDPHYIVLAFLWLAFFAMSVAAFFAILLTGRYPRAIFDFNVGVLRWSWRVAYYAYGALATDRYPPFTLDDADYPAHLEVAYPERLSRGLVLVKWWLLAIPHYIIVGLLMGGTWIVFRGGNWEVGGFGLIWILTIVSGVVLAFTGKYPTQLFDLLLGFNRWVIRVAAYAALMTDEYPPFRLDSGGNEPGGALTMPPSVGSGAPSTSQTAADTTTSAVTTAPRTRSGWTVGPVIALILGCVTALSSLGLFAGGGVALWAHTTQREDGFVTTPSVELSTDAYAIVSEGIELRVDGPDWVLPRTILGDGRLTVSSDEPAFVGIAPTRDIDRYLDGVSQSLVPDLAWRGGLDLPVVDGGGEPATRPGEEDFWIASSEGAGTQSITWPLSNGDWTIVVMNADGSGRVAFEGTVGAEVPVIAPIAIGLLIGGGVLLLIAVALIGGAISRAGRDTGANTTT